VNKKEKPSDIIKEIAQKFFLPLVKHVRGEQEDVDTKSILDYLMHTDTRFVFQAKAKRRFNMRGTYLRHETRPIPGIGNRAVAKDTEVYCLYDKVEDVVCVEVVRDTFDPVVVKSDCFRLTIPEYKAVRDNLEFLDKEPDELRSSEEVG